VLRGRTELENSALDNVRNINPFNPSLIDYILILSDMISHNIDTAAWSECSLHVFSNVEGPATLRSDEH